MRSLKTPQESIPHPHDGLYSVDRLHAEIPLSPPPKRFCREARKVCWTYYCNNEHNEERVTNPLGPTTQDLSPIHRLLSLFHPCSCACEVYGTLDSRRGSRSDYNTHVERGFFSVLTVFAVVLALAVPMMLFTLLQGHGMKFHPEPSPIAASARVPNGAPSHHSTSHHIISYTCRSHCHCHSH